MTRTRPGIERITRQQLRATAIDAERMRDWHLKQCRQCQQAGTDMRMRCLDWWHLSKAAHRARRSLRQWSAPETANIDPLPGME